MPPKQPPAPNPEAAPPLLLSVIVVSYNCAEALRRCLAALEASSNRPSLDVIVADNGSQDETPRLDAEFPAVTILRMPRNFGQTRARNIAIRTAKGAYLLFLRPEVEVGFQTIESLAALLEATPDAAAASPVIVNSAGEPALQAYPLPEPPDLYRIWSEGDWPPPSPLSGDGPHSVDWLPADALLVRTSFVRSMNFLDERYAQYWWDLDLCRQIRRAGKKILLASDLQAVRRHEGGEPVSPSARAVLRSDCAIGAAAYAGKYFGGFQGFKFRAGAILSAMGGAFASLLRAREVSFRFSLFFNLLSGQRVDGTQSAL